MTVKADGQNNREISIAQCDTLKTLLEQAMQFVMTPGYTALICFPNALILSLWHEDHLFEQCVEVLYEKPCTGYDRNSQTFWYDAKSKIILSPVTSIIDAHNFVGLDFQFLGFYQSEKFDAKIGDYLTTRVRSRYISDAPLRVRFVK